MTVAAFALLMAGFPVAFTLAGTALLFALLGGALGAFPLGLLVALPQNIYAVMTNEVLVAVPLFVFMGVMLERSRVAEDLLESMGRLFGRVPGGLVLSVTLVGALLAASTGVVGATVVTMGLLSLPTMLRRGYAPSLAAGSIAAAGTLGQIIPPSIVLVILGDQVGIAFQNAQFEKGVFDPETVGVNDLFAGALLPGLMLVGLYLGYEFLLARLRPEQAPAVRADEAEAGGTGRRLVRALLAPVLLIVAVLGSILLGLASPTEAAGVGAVGALMLAGHRFAAGRGYPILLGAGAMVALVLLARAFDLRIQRAIVPLPDRAALVVALVLVLALVWGILAALRHVAQARDGEGRPVLASVARSTMVISAMVFAIVIGARLFSLAVRGFGGDALIEAALLDLPGGTAAAIAAVMAVMFLLGFVLDFLEIVLIVVPIVAPILLKMEMPGGGGVDPVWLAVMMAMNLQTSFLTPPFGLALFYLRGVAPAELTTLALYRGVAPFVALQLLALLVMWFAPGLATWLPGVIYGD
ncbi:TRAP transporter large permease [Propylenella binzhouense]|uniref:TRAP transporter large permease subunit n=1 Tax=Propylenella binzhouense TaxID=2555902 RepID=A0A964WTQ8_9HYPH|nr:TRAP transporter large permease subunit [Propylenella binzhouense]MYZ48243.1 TRAP transporter large permease subunit [Propylenella binzhouense]